MRKKYIRNKKDFYFIKAIKSIWAFNLILILYYVSTIYWLQFIKSSVLEYSNVVSDKFDWTTYPIAYVPNWLKSKNTNKSLEFEDEKFSIEDFVEIPKYDTDLLSDDSWKNKDAIMARYEYPVVYMWSYRLNYIEFDGSHPWIDIRAPIWTPVLSIANWVVIKTKHAENWDWKYVIIRHDNVNVDWSIETLYSNYLHLSEIFAVEWTKIKKWEILWKVWMTWITTTPHLHLQIDKKVAPFHPFWPYTFKEASSISLDFFSAVNVWLWKENAIAMTTHPLEFVQDNITSVNSFNSAWEDLTISDQIQTSTNEVQKNLWPQVWIKTNTVATISNVNSVITNVKPVEIQPKKLENWQIFYDIPLNSKFYNATKYLHGAWITKWYSNWNFWVNDSISRWEALIFIFKTYNIKLDSNTKLTFRDIDNNSFIAPYLRKALDLWFISANPKFRQDDKVTRAEFITMLIKASWKPINTSTVWYFKDIKNTDWYTPYANTFVKLFPSWANWWQFQPNSLFNRWQISLILYAVKKS